MANTKLFIGLVAFYTFFFVMAGLVPSSEFTSNYSTPSYSTNYNVTEESNTTTTVINTPDLISDNSWTTDLTNFINNIFVNVSGLPWIVNALVFSPLVIIASYWLLMLIKSFIPFIN